MNPVDALILAAVLLVAALGWSEGLVRALWGYTGLMLGTALGLVLAPIVLEDVGLSVWVALAALVIVGASAVGVRILAVRLEHRLRTRINWHPRPWLDHPGGLVFGIVAALGVSWMLGLALAGSNVSSVAGAANRSVALRTLNDVHLPLSSRLVEQFAHLGRGSDFPRYVDVFTAVDIVPVAAPPEDVVSRPGVRRAARSVWRILADGEVMGHQGSGFLVAPERVMTAAHVVPDSRRIGVETDQGLLDATVVVCDARHDVAVLAVPGLKGRVLRFTDAVHGDPAAVIGYPDNGPLTVAPARVRDQGPWQSSDIWRDHREEHDAYSVRGDIRGGDSGGPLVTPAGRALGVVVASSRVDKETGYVLTRKQVAEPLRRSLEPDADAAPCSRDD
ncbi:MarP family serine protease [Nocardioides houyundeii]|uniref:MarP family serine protease n=1 Tax=Nocardioides houyundeii TaxID=2045452 RepID=UPI000C76EC0B|nr:MarP family serine protease [Nocardioides houyundeii]